MHLFILIFCIGCNEPSYYKSKPSNPSEIKSPPQQEKTLNKNLIQDLKQLSTVDELMTYDMVKRKIATQRTQLQSENLQIDSIGKIFENWLVGQIIPFWEGTDWSFEGHTSILKSGTIACGYFVSTTLQDLGLNLSKYKLAQQSPINEARSLALTTEVKEFSGQAKSELILAISQYLTEGIHFIGFDESHVGYILKRKQDLYLIHSNYLNAVGVEIEQIEQSEVFESYNKFYIVQLSSNGALLNHWKKNKKIEIISL